MMDAVDKKLIVQVWGGGPTSCANVANDLPLLNLCATLYAAGELRKMKVFGNKLFAVLYHNIITIRFGA